MNNPVGRPVIHSVVKCTIQEFRDLFLVEVVGKQRPVEGENSVHL
jgi:hypothetical protein